MSAPPRDPYLWNLFHSVDIDSSDSLGPRELQRILVNNDHSHFQLETVRLMIKLFATNNANYVNFSQFTALWRYIGEWQQAFSVFDRDNSGSISQQELKVALRDFGFNVSDRVVALLIQRSSVSEEDPRVTGGRRPVEGINLDCFVRTSVTVRTLTESFKKLDGDGDGWATISYEQFMQLVAENT